MKTHNFISSRAWTFSLLGFNGGKAFSKLAGRGDSDRATGGARTQTRWVNSIFSRKKSKRGRVLAISPTVRAQATATAAEGAAGGIHLVPDEAEAKAEVAENKEALATGVKPTGEPRRREERGGILSEDAQDLSSGLHVNRLGHVEPQVCPNTAGVFERYLLRRIFEELVTFGGKAKEISFVPSTPHLSKYIVHLWDSETNFSPQGQF